MIANRDYIHFLPYSGTCHQAGRERGAIRSHRRAVCERCEPVADLLFCGVSIGARKASWWNKEPRGNLSQWWWVIKQVCFVNRKGQIARQQGGSLSSYGLLCEPSEVLRACGDGEPAAGQRALGWRGGERAAGTEGTQNALRRNSPFLLLFMYGSTRETWEYRKIRAFYCPYQKTCVCCLIGL